MRPTVRTVLATLTVLTVLTLLPSLTVHNLAAQVAAARFDGRPAFAEGIDLGYYLWRDEGDTWHVRWTTMGQQRRFTGSVNAEGGELKNLKRIDVESERKVVYAGRPAHVVRGPRGKVVGVAGGRPPVVATREQDHIEKDGDARIVFAALTNDDIDGFDFKVDKDVTHLRFVLNVDGRERPGSVEIGANNLKINNLPLIVRLR
jgi:hypothetical protein